MKQKRIAILGSTGSIGRQALQEISQRQDLDVCALAANSNWQLLADQARQFRPQAIALSADAHANQLRRHLGDGVELYTGSDAMSEVIEHVRPDLVLNGVVGAAGLGPTMTAITCGATPAIANKETLVMAGEVVMAAAAEAGLEVLPVDSEHSAIFQCLKAGKRDEVARVVITASGGALRDWPSEKLASASVDDALNHPTWSMGPKITVDSATLINKALEVVEAHWLFSLPAEQIDVVIHPQSILHSYVEFQDGSVIAQMGRPDMTLPIAYALGYPERVDRQQLPLDLPALGKLSFMPCQGRFARAVNLGFEVVKRGGLTGAVLNSANEAAVDAFLAGRISFGQIVPIVEELLGKSPSCDEVTLNALLEADAWSRQQVSEMIGAAESSARKN